MSGWNKFKHLLVDGEYAKREKILKDLTLEQINDLPAPGLHTIYGELWHTTKWQNIVVDYEKDKHDKWDKGEVYPAAGAENKEQWNNLVNEFLTGLDKAMKIADSPEEVNKEVEPGITMGDCLDSLAVHNAYHLGKIIALRQIMGAWPPPEETKK